MELLMNSNAELVTISKLIASIGIKSGDKNTCIYSYSLRRFQENNTFSQVLIYFSKLKS